LQVRDRATLYLNMLGGDDAVVETGKDVKEFLFGSLDVPLSNLETSLRIYVSIPIDISSPFLDMKVIDLFFPSQKIMHAGTLGSTL